MAPGFSPLDERLGLLPGSHLTPWLVASVVRLGACVPFAQVPALLAHFTGVTVSAETVRRLTEAAGATLVAHETAVVATLAATLPDPPAGPPVQHLSVDGAMVPLVGGEWAEVKTLALGTGLVAADGTASTTDLSYFSRLTEATTFGDLATIETQRRGTATAGVVVAINDGADWCQGFVDLHRPDAVRILDFPHAVGHLGQVAQAVWGAGTTEASEWLGQQVHALRHGQEATVLAALARLRDDPATAPATGEVIAQTWSYLASRWEQIHYQAFAAAGYPLGSGCVESANKLVVETRLKGPGMHWARANVNPMLALRTAVSNERWGECWTALWPQWRRHGCVRAAQRRLLRRGRVAPQVHKAPPVALPPPPPVPRRSKLVVDGRPTANHPWRRFPPFRAKR